MCGCLHLDPHVYSGWSDRFSLRKTRKLKIPRAINNLKIHAVEQQVAHKRVGCIKKRLADGDFLRQEARAFRYFAAAWAIPRHLSHEAF